MDGNHKTSTNNEETSKTIANKRMQLQREQGIRTQKHITLDEIGRRIAIGDFKELNLIVKADVDGSIEALSDSLLKLSSEEIQVNIKHSRHSDGYSRMPSFCSRTSHTNNGYCR